MSRLFGMFGGGGEGGDDNQDIVHESGASRICNSTLRAVCGAPILMIVSMVLLGWNEQRAVCQAKAIFAGKDAVAEVGCGSAAEGSGDLVMFVCDVDSASLPLLSLPPGSDFASFQVRSVGLATTGEMYQCVERVEESTKKDKVGGGKTTVKTYRYAKQWEDAPVDSSAFQKKDSDDFRTNCGAGVENPQWPTEVPRTGTIRAETIKIGAYTIGEESLISRIPIDMPVLPTNDSTPTGWSISGGAYTNGQWRIGAGTSSGNVIGDVQVSFKIWNANAPTMTVLGLNTDGEVGKWQAPSSWLCSGWELSDLRTGTKDKDTLFSELEAESSALTWALRLVGFAVFWVAFALLAGPLEVAADCVPCIGPCLGGSVKAVTCCIACCPATACTLGVVGIVWVAMRPLVGGPLVAIFLLTIGGLIAFKIYSRRTRRESE